MDVRQDAFLESGKGDGAPDAAFSLRRPERLKTPLVFASPHSGRYYPEDMRAASTLDAVTIRRSEDAYVDELLTGAVQAGIALITANYARAYIDVNREPYELDQAMFEDELPAFARARTARVAAGLGSIARVVSEGQEIYRTKLVYADAERRIGQVHRPYHAALSATLNDAKTTFGAAILIDWHSMPSAATGSSSTRSADFVLGDRFGAACSRHITEAWERALQDRGYRVVRNAPYAGGHTTEFYGKPNQSFHALQIEINRGLYLDEPNLRTTERFSSLKRDLDEIFTLFVDAGLTV